MKTKLLSMMLTAVMTMSSLTMAAYAVDYSAEYPDKPTANYSQTFNDVPKSHWGFSYIGAMVQRGVLDGYPDGNFYPDNTVTRAEFAKIMMCAAKRPVYWPSYKYFQDVETDAWYAPYVHSAYPFLSGYVYGEDNRYYMPDEPALREDIAVALVKLKGYDTAGADTSILTTMFTDVSSISLDARKYVAVAVDRGLVSGYDDKTFRGQASVTRAEAAAMLWRAYQYGNDNKVFDDEYYDGGNNYYYDDDDNDSGNNYGYGGSSTVRATPTPRPTRTPRPTTTSTPKSTKTPHPTEIPTPNPTPTPKPTPTPEPPRPYEMDTITKADVASMTYDNDDNIYYYDISDNMVYMINMDSERISDVIDVGELTMRDDGKFDHEVNDIPESEPTEKPENDENAGEIEENTQIEQEIEYEDPIEHYLDFDVNRLYYDKKSERLLLAGKFQHITDWQRPDEKFNADADTIYLDITNSDEPILYTVEITSFNDWSLIASTNDSEYSIKYSYDENYEAHIYNDYSINGRLVRYSYNSRKWVNVTDRELPRFSKCALNTNGDLYYFWDGVSGGMFTCNLDGVVRNIDIQSKDDIYIADKTNWPYSYYGSKNHVAYFHPCNNGKFVFYDTEAQAIRGIRGR